MGVTRFWGVISCVVCLTACAKGAETKQEKKETSAALETPPTQIQASEPKVSPLYPTSLTIYTDKSGIVREKFELELKPGINRVVFKNIPTALLTGSVFLKFSPESPDIHILERTHGSKPASLTFLVRSKNAEKVSAELNYLVTNIRWRIFYVAVLSTDQRTIGLNGWVQVDNQSGKNYKKTKIQLISAPGTLKEEKKPDLQACPGDKNKKGDKAPLPTQVVSMEDTLPYGYYLAEPIELLHEGNKHISWAQAQDITATQDYRIQIERKYLNDQDEEKISLPIETWISFKNTSESGGHIRRDLPAGFMTIYQREKTGALQIAGTSKISHTPANGDIQFKVPASAALGENVDDPTQTEGLEQVTTSFQQTNFRRLSRNIVEASYQLKINNPTGTDVWIKVHAETPLKEKWDIARENIAHESSDPQGGIIWNLKIGAKDETVLQYRLRLSAKVE